MNRWQTGLEKNKEISESLRALVAQSDCAAEGAGSDLLGCTYVNKLPPSKLTRVNNARAARVQYSECVPSIDQEHNEYNSSCLPYSEAFYFLCLASSVKSISKQSRVQPIQIKYNLQTSIRSWKINFEAVQRRIPVDGSWT